MARDREGAALRRDRQGERDDEALRMPRLPAAPLAAVLDERIRRDLQTAHRNGHPGRGKMTRESVCKGYGTTARDLNDWLQGRRALVQFDVADRVLLALGLLWFDVWEPAEFPEVAALFDHEPQAA